MVQLGLKDSSRNYTPGYGIGFVSYLHLTLLISDQMFKVTVAHKIFWDRNKQHPLLGWSSKILVSFTSKLTNSTVPRMQLHHATKDLMWPSQFILDQSKAFIVMPQWI